MAYMLGPESFGLPSIIPPPSTPLGHSIVKALMAKHGVSVPAVGPANPAPNTAPEVGSDVGTDAGRTANVVAGLGTMQPADVNIPGGDTPLVNPNDAMGLQQFADSAPQLKAGGGFLDRIGDFLRSDEGRAALLRSGAETLQHGLGAGIAAGANFMDQRRAERAAAAEAATRDALKVRELDDNREYHLGELDNQADQNAITRDYNEGRLDNDRYSTNSENYRANLHERGETMRTGMSQAGENYRTGMTVGEQHFQHITPSGDTLASQAGETQRTGMQQAGEDRRTNLQFGPRRTIHTHYTTTPEDFAANGPRLRPSQVRPAGGGQGQPEVRFDASGQAYVQGPDGSAVRAPQYDRR